MEYFIDQEIELIHDNKTIKLKIEESKTESCANCFFKTSSCIRHIYNMADAYCSPATRSDEKSIIFKQIK